MKRWICLALCLCLIPSAFAGVFLHEYMYEGETKIIPANGGYYEIRLVTVSDFTEKAIFSVNGELSKALTERETDVLKDGSRIYTGDILIDEDGKDMVEIYFIGTGESVLYETIAESAEIPFIETQPGPFEESPTFRTCDGCKMNGDCYPPGYQYNPNRDTIIACSQDGTWEEQLPLEEPIDVVAIWDTIFSWLGLY